MLNVKWFFKLLHLSTNRAGVKISAVRTHLEDTVLTKGPAAGFAAGLAGSVGKRG